jgi:hypothetical protein
MHYNFVRIHQTLKVTPAMAAGVTAKLWEMADMVKVLEDWEQQWLQINLFWVCCEQFTLAKHFLCVSRRARWSTTSPAEVVISLFSFKLTSATPSTAITVTTDHNWCAGTDTASSCFSGLSRLTQLAFCKCNVFVLPDGIVLCLSGADNTKGN